VRWPPWAAHLPPRPGRPRPGTAPLRRPARQGRQHRVPRGGRRLPGQGRAAPSQVRPVIQQEAAHSPHAESRPNGSYLPAPAATVTIRPSPVVTDGS
jgi:hypothetical protein